MLPRIEVDAKRARKAAVANYSLATDLADYLVRKGLPFRDAHEALGKLVRYAEGKNADLGKLTLDELRKFSPVFDRDALGIDVMTSVRSRDVPGGTAPRQVAASIRRARKRIDALARKPAAAPKKRTKR
jgi:argininosuccinate lyase